MFLNFDFLFFADFVFSDRRNFSCRKFGFLLFCGSQDCFFGRESVLLRVFGYSYLSAADLLFRLIRLRNKSLCFFFNIKYLLNKN